MKMSEKNVKEGYNKNGTEFIESVSLGAKKISEENYLKV